jgi:hypothetical protein
MMKPSRRDRRRREAREALYRAELRREQIIATLVLNANRIKRLRTALARLDRLDPLHVSNQPLSVSAGQLLADYFAGKIEPLNDDIPDLTGAS